MIRKCIRWCIRYWCRAESTWLRRKLARAIGAPLMSDRLRLRPVNGKYPWFAVTTACHQWHIMKPHVGVYFARGWFRARVQLGGLLAERPKR